LLRPPDKMKSFGSKVSQEENEMRIMRMMVVMSVLAVVVMTSGCLAIDAKTATRPRSLKGDHMVYFEQSDRIPKDVLLAAHGKDDDPVVNALGAFPPEAIAKVIEEIVKIMPELAEVHAEERMWNALIGRRMLFRGYESPEQLKEINEIIKSMSGAIENVTPQK